jgi:uncharacterized protein YndB with AHSA1/START domain
MTADRDELGLRLERVLPAPPSVVFRAQTEPDELAKWWGPKGFTAPSVELDVRVGGSYRIAMQPPDGDLFHLSGEFREVGPPARLSYTFRWDPPNTDDRETVVTISLRDLGGSTEMTVEQGGFATEERRALHEQGWTDSLDRLQGLISRQSALERLDAFIGEWSMKADFPLAPATDIRGRCMFEWMSGQQFLVQRWEVSLPEAPDGIAIIGFDTGRNGYLQHYFDSRGVARVYEMSFENGVWKLWRDTADFSPLNFSQRFTGTFSGDGKTIEGHWEICHDGSSWEHDFDLTYTKVG